jgi:hypothetical protein
LFALHLNRLVCHGDTRDAANPGLQEQMEHDTLFPICTAFIQQPCLTPEQHNGQFNKKNVFNCGFLRSLSGNPALAAAAEFYLSVARGPTQNLNEVSSFSCWN